MKPQDIFLIIIFVVLLWKSNPKWSLFSGLSLLILSFPLFVIQIFFTAERFIMYSCLFFLHAVILLVREEIKSSPQT